MARRWSRISIALAVPLAAALAAASSRARIDFDPHEAPPPWRHRCRIAIAAYEDGSASLFCAGHDRRFATVDAESGRIRMRMPWAGGPDARAGGQRRSGVVASSK